MGNQIEKLNKKFGKKQAPIKKVPTAIEVKTYIMVAQNKLTLYRNKKVNMIKMKRKEIAHSLRENNLDVAKAKMDSVIKEEDLITVYDILGPLCEILKEKVTYLMTHNECPSDLKAPLDTLIYASSRLEVDELHKLRELIMLKYGELYVNKGDSNADGLVNKNLIEKLKVKQTSDTLITIRLKQLCKEDNVPFEFPCEIVGNEFSPYGPGQPGMPPSDFGNPFGGMPGGGNQPVNPYASQFGGGDYQQGGWNPNMQNQGQNPYGNWNGPGPDNYGNQGDFGPDMNNNPYGGGNNNPYGGGNNNPYEGGNNNPYGGGNNDFGGFGNFQGGNKEQNIRQSGFGGGFNAYNQNINSNNNSKMSGINDFQGGNQSMNKQSQMSVNPYQRNMGPSDNQNPYASQYSNANNISSDFPKNPSQFNQNEFPQNNSQMKPNDFPQNPTYLSGSNFQRNPNQMGPNDFPQTPIPKNPSQLGPSDFPKNPSQMGPSDFPRNPSQMGPSDFPRNPSQMGPSDFPKNPSQMEPTAFPKNPSQMGPSDFPKNPSRMGPSDFPKNPSQMGPSDFPNNVNQNKPNDFQMANSTVPKPDDFPNSPSDFPQSPSDFPGKPNDFPGNVGDFPKDNNEFKDSNDQNINPYGNNEGFGGFPKSSGLGDFDNKKTESVNIPSQSQIPDLNNNNNNNNEDDDLFKNTNSTNPNFNPYSYEFDNPNTSNLSSVSEQKFVNKPPENYKGSKLPTLLSQIKGEEKK